MPVISRLILDRAFSRQPSAVSRGQSTFFVGANPCTRWPFLWEPTPVGDGLQDMCHPITHRGKLPQKNNPSHVVQDFKWPDQPSTRHDLRFLQRHEKSQPKKKPAEAGLITGQGPITFDGASVCKQTCPSSWPGRSWPTRTV